jgi:hypothetical protein
MPRTKAIRLPFEKVAEILGVAKAKDVAAEMATTLKLRPGNIRGWKKRGIPLDYLERIVTASGYRMDIVYAFCFGQIPKLPDRDQGARRENRRGRIERGRFRGEGFRVRCHAR